MNKDFEANLLQTYAKYPLEITKGEGSFVFDEKGNKYLDFYGGHAVTILGHCPPIVQEAIERQVKEFIFYSNIVYSRPQVRLADLLVQDAPGDYQVFFMNSGAEANETALKISRKFTQKGHIISFRNSFHGRSAFASAVTGIDSYRNFQPNFDELTSFAEFGNMTSVQDCFRPGETAAVILEPIQSIGGARKSSRDFYEELGDFCKEKGILLITDEVQTGLGRTGGEFYFSKKVKLEPDMITLAKGIASGLPISAVLISEKIARTIKTGEYATTFGGGALVCAAGVATVSAILSKNFLDEVQNNADYLRGKLKQIKAVKSLHGEGFLVGLELVKEDPDLIKNCLQEGLIIGSSYQKNIFRLLPPINISRSEIDQGVDFLSKVINSN